jgi:serine/threonine protein kinase
MANLYNNLTIHQEKLFLILYLDQKSIISTMLDIIGKLLGKVRIDMFLAQGGMADVYLGTHTTLQRAVAVKVMKNDLLSDPDLKERFEREARVVAMLRHPNIVQVFDFDTYQGKPYLVMEFVSGTTLGSYLRKLHENNLRLEHAQIGLMLNKLADALNYAHEKGVIHRDIKPGNIMLTSPTIPITAGNPLPGDTQPIVTDFGLVRFKQSASQTASGVITGTPSYMSPEQARGAVVDARTDIYSLGVTVYEMLAGRVPFDSDSTLTVLHMHIYEPPPPIKGLTAPMQGVIDRVLAKDPKDRFQSVVEFARAFQDALYGTAETPTIIYPTTDSKTITSPPKPALVTSLAANKWFQFGFGALFVGLVSIAVLMNANKPLQPAAVPSSGATQDSAYSRDNSYQTMPDMNSTPNANISTAPVIGLLRFQDGSAVADQVTLSTTSMPLPSQGYQYEVWLIEESGEQRRSIGIISFDKNNKGSLTYVDSQGRNLLGIYHALEITVETNPDPSPNPSNQVAYFVSLPQGGLMHVRHLLYSFSGAPNKIALVQGLAADAKIINKITPSMLSAYQAGNEADVRLMAEQVLNVIVGSQSDQHKDWNGDGKVDDPSDGYGLLLNGDNAGYIQGTYSHADYATHAADATQNMILHGEHVKICATNVAGWAPKLRDLLVTILNSSSGSGMESSVRQAVVLANQIQNGIDLNGNEKVEPIPGEGGALTAYAHAYYMADISIQTDSQPK